MTRSDPTEAYEQHVRTNSGMRSLVGLGVCCFGAALIPALSFVAPALCISLGALAGSSFGLRTGLVLSGYAVVMFLTGTALGRGEVGPAALVVVTTLAAGILLGRSAELRLRLQNRRARGLTLDAELSARRRQHEVLLSILADAIYRVDRAGTVVRGSDQIEGSESNTEWRVGKNLADFLPRDLAKNALESVQAVLMQDEPTTFEYRTGGREPRDFEARVVRGGVHEVLVILRDVSDVKKLEVKLAEAHRDALTAAGTKGRFLATMSHQIRTPMNGVIGMTNVLLQTRLTPEQREYTTIIRNSGEALLSILDDVLDFTRIEDGQMVLVRTPFALRELLEELVELLAARAHHKGLEIASIIDARVPAWVQGDRGRLRQVIINLLGNAIKFTHRGHIALRAAVVGHERDTALIRFDVCDTGVGIPVEHQKNLFQDYAQAHRAIARQHGGTGLGLAISRQIVELMGGRMVVESSEDTGSTFSFTARFTTVQDRTTRSFLLPRSLSGAHIVSLALHPLTRELIEHQLAPLGAKLIVAESLDHYATLLQERSAFDATLVELALGVGARAASELLMAVAKLSAHMPIVALCSLGQRPIVDQARRAGASIVLSRPLRRSSLYDGLVALLGLTARPPGRSTRPGRPEAAAGNLRARVLVAEDNLVNQKVAVRSLELLGCHVEVAENGAMALEALKQREFDVVLMDCQMPVLDGFEATQQIRELELALARRTPIIAVTANAMPGDRERCLAAGMDDYLAKPVTLAGLDEVLRKWLPGQVLYGPRSDPDRLGPASQSPPKPSDA